jgi:hypothetical protein
VVVAILYRIGLIGTTQQHRWGPLVVCVTVAIDSIDIVSGLVTASINALYAAVGSIFLLWCSERLAQLIGNSLNIHSVITSFERILSTPRLEEFLSPRSYSKVFQS